MKQLRKRVLPFLLVVIFATSVIAPVNVLAAKTKTYSVNKTWKVSKQWNFKFTSAKTTKDRNKYADKAKQVVVLKYNYENIGYESDLMGLYFSSVDMKVYDEKGVAAKMYPLVLKSSPQELIVGTKCVGAEAAFALKSKSKKITVVIEQYDSNYKKHTAKFTLKV